VAVLTVRALAEKMLYDTAQARRLVAAARGENQPSMLLDLVGRIVETPDDGDQASSSRTRQVDLSGTAPGEAD